MLLAGHDVPAGGVVPLMLPTVTPSAPTSFAVSLTVSPALRSNATAPATDVCPATEGTTIIFGPADTARTIVAPLTARPDGDVLITSPLGTVLSMTGVPSCGLNPAVRNDCSAAATGIPSTAGSDVYRPDVSHQLPMPMAISAAAPAARNARRLLNSQRCRN